MPLHRARTIDSVEESSTSHNNHHDHNNSHESRGSDGTDDVLVNLPRQDGGGGGASTEILFTSGELSSASAAGDGTTTAAAHRNMMMAGLLEHYYHSRALDFLVAANPAAAASGHYHRDSPEVRQLGGQLLAQATQRLGASGVLDVAAAAEDNADIRRQYLLGLDSIAVPGVNVETLCSDEGQVAGAVTAMDLDVQGLNINSTNKLGFPYLPHPANDLQLAVRHHQHQSPAAVAAQPHQQRSSHYRTSFEEVGFLGKGGFGSVFKCWNRFDDRMYAVKKIPLSPRLSKSFCEGGHDRLGKLLREVRALATFDHANIVRYHATWIEEPSQYSTANTTGMMPTRATGGLMPGQAMRRGGGPPQRRQVKLLEHRPMAIAAASNNSSSARMEPSFSDGPVQNDISAADDIVFGFDTGSGSEQFSKAGHDLAAGPQWSDNPSSANRIEELSSSEALDEDEDEDDSDIFTDGDPNAHGAKSIIATGIPMLDPTVHVLHIQMSLYPMTLAQYLSPSRAPTHCFHLLPSLRLLLSILTGLQYIHSKGLVHRDIKPGNIFLSPSTAGGDSSGSGSTDTSHGGYCNVGDCDSCSVSSPSEVTETSTTTPVTPAPVWLNPRIGDFGLVTQLAREGLSSSPDALEHSLGGGAGAEMSSEKDEHLVGTMYYRPPRWPQSQPSSPERRRNQQQHPTSPVRGAARRDENVGGGGNTSSRKRHSMDEKLDIFALGVVLVEMLACCHTAMQRVDMLKAIQDGRVPVDDIRRCCALQDGQHRSLCTREGAEDGGSSYECKISSQVIALVEGMLALDPDERWDDRTVRTAVETILADYNSTRSAGRLL